VSAELFLSTADGTPMYQQIVDQITAKVMAGDWAPGQALPSIRELASASQVSVITVKRAYAELELAGIIVTRQGKGSFVADSANLPTDLLRAEFQQHLDAMLDCATRLGLTREQLHRLLDETQPQPPSAPPRGTTP
jgi:GntR family transcriptional regulator